ncbi:MAG TPA: DUF3108 domain-containing protein [Pyrinomonadaceae bacterium]|jgi:hypothetical protein|nr:DUF3108 domain-containing protein [Pyrinomonadaceae bacterium]
MLSLLALSAGVNQAQPAMTSANRRGIGERLTYTISVDKLQNAGYLELQTVSTGQLSGRDVIELSLKVKTFDLLSAAFFLLDERRTTFISPETGLPVYIDKIKSDGPIPKETILNFLSTPATGHDLSSFIYKARSNVAAGTFQLFEDGQLYTVTLRPAKSDHVRTDAGEFDTAVCPVASEYLTAHNIKDFTVAFSTDEQRVPVLFRFSIGEAKFRVTLSAISRAQPAVVVAPTPTPVSTPVAPVTPRPTPSPTPYVENLPLSPELNFSIGESLDYSVTAAGQPAGIITTAAKERKLVGKDDTLFLTAIVTAVEPGSRLLTLGDHVQALVDPETLEPRSVESSFSSTLKGLTQTVTIDQRTGLITVPGAQPIDGPVGTHTLLSLIYALRSFNLSPSLDRSSPINDTRVAVFWEDRPYIFTLRPSKAEEITVNGQKVLAQMISITTGNAQLDSLAPKVWLSMTDGRVPVRYTAGALQADLIKK